MTKKVTQKNDTKSSKPTMLHKSLWEDSLRAGENSNSLKSKRVQTGRHTQILTDADTDNKFALTQR